MLISQENIICIVQSGICGRRGLDLAKLTSYLTANGYHVSFEPGEGDVLVFWGCAFNASNERISMRNLRSLAPPHTHAHHRYKCIFVMEGIAMTVSLKELSSSTNSDVISIPMNNMEELDTYFYHSIRYSEMAEENDTLVNPESNKKTWFIQVAHGCLDNCSYCGDKKIVGELRSKPLQNILEECRHGLSKGYTTIHLLGDDIGAYGRDIGITVFDLLDSVTALPELKALELEEINIKYLLKDIGRLRHLCSREKFKQFSMAFQHVDDAILKRMNRGYSKQEIEALFDILNKAGVHIRFHAIIGFPGESREQLSDLLVFIIKKRMPSGDIFIYQKREYAPSAIFDEHFSDHEIARKIDFTSDFLTENGYIVSKHYLGVDYLPDKLVVKQSKCNLYLTQQHIDIIKQDAYFLLQPSEQWQDYPIHFEEPKDFSDTRFLLFISSQAESPIALRIAFISSAHGNSSVLEKWFQFNPGYTIAGFSVEDLAVLEGVPDKTGITHIYFGGITSEATVHCRLVEDTQTECQKQTAS